MVQDKRQTIEFNTYNPNVGRPAGGYNVYEHDSYPDSSVLGGQPRRSFMGYFDTIEFAQTAYPGAISIEGSTKHYGDPLPREPPAWFNESAAGEHWHEDDY